jgi:hypothetical protein
MTTPAPASWHVFRDARIPGRVLTAGYLVAAAALLFWGAWKRFQLPQWPIIQPDIVGYLGPAIAALAGKPFTHMIGRSFPYPAFVYLILRIFGDFRAIAVIQHLLGVAAGGLVLLAWDAAGALAPAAGIPRPLFRFMGLAPAYVVLGSATEIAFEHEILPEAIFPFLTILNIWVSFLFLDARFARRRPSFIWLGALNVFAACLIYLTKPSFGFAALFSTLPVWLCLVLPGCSMGERAGLAAGAILPALLLLFLPEHILKRDDPASLTFLPETLLTIHASIVERQLTEDLAGNQPLPYPRPVVQAARDLLATELAKASHTPGKTYPSLGYNPDYLMYENSFCTKFSAEEHFTGAEMGRFCMTYYIRALRHHPGAMAAKVLRQLRIFYARKNPVYWAGKRMNLSDAQHYGRVGRLMVEPDRLGPGNPVVARYIAACNGLAGRGVALPQSRHFAKWLRLFSAHYLDLLVVAALSPILLFLRPLRAHFLWLIAAVWLACSYNFGNSLTIAVVHSLEVNRYVRIQLIFTIFAQCLTLGLVLELAVFWARGAIGKRTAANRSIAPEGAEEPK